MWSGRSKQQRLIADDFSELIKQRRLFASGTEEEVDQRRDQRCAPLGFSEEFALRCCSSMFTSSLLCRCPLLFFFPNPLSFVLFHLFFSFHTRLFYSSKYSKCIIPFTETTCHGTFKTKNSGFNEEVKLHFPFPQDFKVGKKQDLKLKWGHQTSVLMS